jgi:transposase
MTTIARIGIDTSKSVFQLHGVDEAAQPVLKRKLRRREFLAFFGKLEPTEIGIEACGASHYWARELDKLGHQVLMLPPQYVRPYVERNKNDAADAEAICEALSRPKVRKRRVAVKSAEQSALQMLLGTREGLIRRRTQLSNAIRSYAAEFGLVIAKGLARIEPLLEHIAIDEGVPAIAKEVFVTLGTEFRELAPRIAELDDKLMAWHRGNELSCRLREVPTIGPIGACLLTIKVPDPRIFQSGRHFAAWIGLTAKDHSSGGKQKLGGITRAGDEPLRAVLVSGATALIAHVRRGRGQPTPWLAGMLERKPPKLVATALANKTARIAWKLMISGQRYDQARTTAPLAAAA